MKHLLIRLSLCLSLCLLLPGPSFADESALLPAINTPSPDSQLLTSTQTFTWESNGTEASLWWFSIGSSFGIFDIYNSSYALESDQLSVNVTDLPTDGSTLYVRLYYLTTDWEFVDHQYTAADDINAALDNMVAASGELPTNIVSEPSISGGVVGIVERYTQALAAGDVNQLKSLLGGRLLQSRRVLLEENAAYPEKLQQTYNGASFIVTASAQTSEQYQNSQLVKVDIQLPSGQKSTETLILQESTTGSTDWKVIDYVR